MFFVGKKTKPGSSINGKDLFPFCLVRPSCKAAILFSLVLAILVSNSAVLAKPVNAIQAEKVVKSWLKITPEPLGTTLGRQVGQVQTFSDVSGQPIYYVAYLEPCGFIIISADDLIEPIIAFADDGFFEPSLDNPLGALVSYDLKARVTSARSLSASQLPTGSIKTSNTKAAALHNAALTARAKWQQLSRPSEKFDGELIATGQPSIADIRVEPLIQSKWNQVTACGLSCYNYYTPPYDPNTPENYPAGCVATMMAQLMRFYEYPVTGIGVQPFTIYVDGNSVMASTRGGDGDGGPYDWNDMTLVPNCAITDTQRQAIGAVCYDAGLSVNMMYDVNGSGAYMHDAKYAMKTTFGYSNAVLGGDEWFNIGAGLTAMINPNLDAGYSTLLGVNNGSSGHAIIADGYGYNSETLYHHLNMGWSGADDAWYNLPTISGTYANYTSVNACIYNIFLSGSGEIISGRVVDVNAEPISGAEITAEKTGGGTYTTTTNSKGIYALTNLPSASTYTVSVTKTGYDFDSQDVTTTTSLDWQSSSGNKWAIDFTGTVSEPCADLNDDYKVNIIDFAILAKHFLQNNCSEPNWCQGADFDYSGDVDYIDLEEFIMQWLTTIEIEETFISIGSQDGRVYDNNDGIGAAHTADDSTAVALRLGDYLSNEGYRIILSFDTSSLPDDCNIISAVLELVRGEKWGNDDPFEWGGPCIIDINSPCIGTSTALENYDWQGPVGDVNVATFLGDPNEGNPMVSTYFDPNGLNSISKTDTTQIRVYLTNSTNSDSDMDFLGFYGGEATNQNNAPKLIIQYSID